jgi:hypothetical protein
MIDSGEVPRSLTPALHRLVELPRAADQRACRVPGAAISRRRRRRLAEPARPRRAAVAAGLCCRFVDAETVNNLGGACQIVGVLLVVRDLLPVTRYRGVPGQVASWLRGRRAKVTALARRLFRRPPRHQVVHGGAAEIEIAPQATLRSFPGPFTARPGQSLEDRLAQLGHLVNRLRDDVEAERNERRRAISEERQARQRELRAETQQRQAAADALGQEFQELQELQEVTTGGSGCDGRACRSCSSASGSRRGRTASRHTGRAGCLGACSWSWRRSTSRQACRGRSMR